MKRLLDKTLWPIEDTKSLDKDLVNDIHEGEQDNNETIINEYLLFGTLLALLEKEPKIVYYLTSDNTDLDDIIESLSFILTKFYSLNVTHFQATSSSKLQDMLQTTSSSSLNCSNSYLNLSTTTLPNVFIISHLEKTGIEYQTDLLRLLKLNRVEQKRFIPNKQSIGAELKSLKLPSPFFVIALTTVKSYSSPISLSKYVFDKVLISFQIDAKYKSRSSSLQTYFTMYNDDLKNREVSRV